MEIFPSLPQDIARLILECSAEQDRNSALTLAYLSRQVRSWIDQIIYRSVVIEHPRQAEAFCWTLGQRHKSFFQTHVYTICFAYGITLRHTVKILSVCDRLSSLACWIEPASRLLPTTTVEATVTRVQPHLFTMLSVANIVSSFEYAPRRLSCTLHHLQCTTDPDFSAPLLENVTHLDLYRESQFFYDWSWKGFCEMQNLMYLSFDLSIAASLDVITYVLAFVPASLRVCLVLFHRGDSMFGSIDDFFETDERMQAMVVGDVDRRLVIGSGEALKRYSRYKHMVLERTYKDVLKDWSHSLGEEDMWTVAQEIIFRRWQR
ncbi:hypothetical protein PLEOSDRAFT_1109744 [Pleurotus ostreatus PC15]|uniref:F-box domain-containing protein n=1 Tax=Pleurotus ostreatus (strain PC15) TaxID=1137138 RepID=A0A067NFT6_PLEO1|nr:hypothetical protein PLEOSDRAFT_1109744 [Pleurotus ostreatus PC15]